VLRLVERGARCCCRPLVRLRALRVGAGASSWAGVSVRGRVGCGAHGGRVREAAGALSARGPLGCRTSQRSCGAGRAAQRWLAVSGQLAGRVSVDRRPARCSGPTSAKLHRRAAGREPEPRHQRKVADPSPHSPLAPACIAADTTPSWHTSDVWRPFGTPRLTPPGRCVAGRRHGCSARGAWAPRLAAAHPRACTIVTPRPCRNRARLLHSDSFFRSAAAPVGAVVLIP